MKLGLISDIHANADALKQVLEAMQAQGVEQILCAGDLVERGTQGDLVIELMQQHNIPCVLGNHDEFAPANQTWFRENLDPDHENYRKHVLNENTIAYLAGLPRTLRFEFEGKKVFLAHGTPWDNINYVFPLYNPSQWQRIYEDTQADIVVLGHSHIPLEIHYIGMQILNPGSVSSVFGSGTYGILSLPDCQYTVYNVQDGSRVDLDAIAAEFKKNGGVIRR